MNAVFAWPRMMDPEMAETYCGGDAIFQDILDRKLIKPRVKRKKCTRYDKLELDHALTQWPGFSEE